MVFVLRVVGELGAERMYRVGGGSLTRYDLYEMAVQSPEMVSSFLRALHGGGGSVLGDDFAGAAGVARGWLRLDARHRAVAVDRDEGALEEAVRRQVEWDRRVDAPAGEVAGLDRLTVRARDVLEAGDRADVVCALNFGVCELHRRERLLTYLRNVVYRLEAGGVFVADVYGGADSMTLGTFDRVVGLGDELGGGELVYHWEQRWADPTTGRVGNAIHFTLPGGERVEEAFVYDWRLWSTVELREAMLEAGFSSTEVHDSYGGAVDDEGRLYVSAVSEGLDGPWYEGGVDDGGEDGEYGGGGYVHYVVGRV